VVCFHSLSGSQDSEVIVFYGRESDVSSGEVQDGMRQSSPVSSFSKLQQASAQ